GQGPAAYVRPLSCQPPADEPIPGQPTPATVGAADGDGPVAGTVAGTPDPSADGADPGFAGADAPGAPDAALPGAVLAPAGALLPSPGGTVAVATATGEPVGT